MEFKADNVEISIDNKIVYIIASVAIIAAVGNIVKAIIWKQMIVKMKRRVTENDSKVRQSNKGLV